MTVGRIVAAELVVVTVVAPALAAEVKILPETPTVVAKPETATVVPEVKTGPTLAAESETITMGLALAEVTGVPTFAVGPEVTNAEPTLATELGTTAGPTLASVVATVSVATLAFTAVPRPSLVGAVFCDGAETEVEPNSRPMVVPRLGLTGPTSGAMVEAAPTPTGVECAYPKDDEGPRGTNT